MSIMLNLISRLEQQTRTISRIQLLRPEVGLTEEQIARIEKYYRLNGVKLSIGCQLEVIRIYDQGCIFPYECTINNKNLVVMFASVYEYGEFRIKQDAVCSETWFNKLMERDTVTIQNIAVSLFPTLYM